MKALIVVVCISKSVVHLGTKNVSGVEKSPIGRRIVKLKTGNLQKPEKVSKVGDHSRVMTRRLPFQ